MYLRRKNPSHRIDQISNKYQKFFSNIKMSQKTWLNQNNNNNWSKSTLLIKNKNKNHNNNDNNDL